MARIVIRTQDTVRTDQYQDVHCYKRGMVADILEDGREAGSAIESSNRWVIVDVPGVRRDDLTAFLAWEPGDPKVDRMLQRRAFKFDLDAWDGRKTLTLAEALSHKRPMPKRADPNVLSGDSRDRL